ncbi:Diguanylate cyclase [Candidatus Methylobacter favarea]|uniref:diguanylate cyclase n=1 Tax=Candidatus Methylobacter favarea TaxID=2707345 RepID=A0A8S0WY35_9GAMM|nr:HDOD domain-containing protein [Candidatus Methylobacter favarea]CAA9889413.1 Diguanylate cyclase [Candidatus Methylobacter favarea]
MIDESRENIENIKIAAQSILKHEIKQLQLVPSVAIKLLKLTNDDNARIQDLSRIIETEPTLAAKVLRNVNSAAYALPKKITSINRAVNILGFSAVRQIALALLFYNKMIKHISRQKFNQLFFWQHCLFVASLSREIAVALKHPDPDLVYTAGLIHDIGKVVLETYGRVTYSDFIASLAKKKYSLIEQERSFFGISHTEMGLVFCLEWQLPPPITAVIACHHNQPPEASPYAGFRTEIAIVSFADYIAWMQGIGSIKSDGHPVLQHEVLKIINLHQLDLEALLQHVDQEMQNTREFYGIQFPSVTKLRATLVQATINLSQLITDPSFRLDYNSKNRFSSSLIAAHQSLNPDEFLPWTLEAIQRDFAFDHVIMLNIDPKRRCLMASYWWPTSMFTTEQPSLEIKISIVSGILLDCLREKKAVIVNDNVDRNNPILQRLKVKEFIAVPVLHHNRLIGVLYADNSQSKKPIYQKQLAEIAPVADQLGIALVKAEQYEMEKKRAQIDPLTELFNKRMIDQFLTQIFKREKSKRENIAIGFIDIDNFKQFNDVCGHQAGDDALKIVADIMRSLTRPGDFIGRYGGEEFLFVLKNTDEAGAYGYAERIRTEIEHRGKIMKNRFHNLALTVSVGISMYNPRYSSYTKMVEIADQAMYRAKNEGRNRIVMLANTAPPIN